MPKKVSPLRSCLWCFFFNALKGIFRNSPNMCSQTMCASCFDSASRCVLTQNKFEIRCFCISSTWIQSNSTRISRLNLLLNAKDVYLPKSSMPWKSITIKIIVLNFGWLEFPTQKIVFGENQFLFMVFGLPGVRGYLVHFARATCRWDSPKC